MKNVSKKNGVKPYNKSGTKSMMLNASNKRNMTKKMNPNLGLKQSKKMITANGRLVNAKTPKYVKKPVMKMNNKSGKVVGKMYSANGQLKNMKQNNNGTFSVIQGANGNMKHYLFGGRMI